MKLVNTDVPERWNKGWLVIWAIALPVVPALALQLPFDWWPNFTFREWRWIALIGFGVPEAISLVRKRDSLPPLTQTIRHFLPGWFAFTYIYGMAGAIGATWFGFARPFHLGAMFGLLGWLTEHFTFTYIEGDPMPVESLRENGVAARSHVEAWQKRRTF